jgi:hypothetical protein
VQHDAPSTYAGLGGSGAEDAFVGKVYVDLNPLLMRVQDRERRGQGGQILRQRRSSRGPAEGDGDGEQEELGLLLWTGGGGGGGGGEEEREVLWGKEGEEALVIQVRPLCQMESID